MSTTFASDISSNGGAEAQGFSDRAPEHHKGERSSLPPVPVWMTSPDWSFRQDLTRGGSAVLSEDHILSGEHTGLAKNVCECVCHHPCVSIWGMHNLLAFLGRAKTVKLVVYTLFKGKLNFLRTHRSHFQVHLSGKWIIFAIFIWNKWTGTSRRKVIFDEDCLTLDARMTSI